LPLGEARSKWAKVAAGEEASKATCTIALLGNPHEGREKVGIPIPRATRICHVEDFTVVRLG